MNLCDIREVKALLERHGFRFSKAKGQNFLIQDWVPKEIVRQGGVMPDSCVLEVGPGIGPLTRELCAAAKKVVAVEVDESLRPILAETLSGCKNLTLRFGDILKEDLPSLVREAFGESRPMACCQPSLLHHFPHPLQAAGKPLFFLRHGDGAKRGGRADLCRPRHPGLQRLYRLLPVPRHAQAPL